MNTETLELLFDVVIKNHAVLDHIPNELEKFQSKKYGITLLGYAVEHNLSDLYNCLINRNNSDIYNVNLRKESILHIICRNQSNMILDENPSLLNIFNFSQVDIHGSTIFHICSDFNTDLSFLLTLLKNKRVTKEHLNIQDNNKNTFLHYVVHNSDEEKIISVLSYSLLKGANIYFKNHSNNTIYDLVKQYKLTKVINLLKPHFEFERDQILLAIEEANRKERIMDPTCFDLLYIEKLFNTIIHDNLYLMLEYLPNEIDKYQSKKFKMTLLGMSILYQIPELCKILINRNNSDIYKLSSRNESILHICSMHELLIISDVNPTFIDKFDFKCTDIDKRTVLHSLALNFDKTDLLFHLLQHEKITKEHLDMQDKKLQTCLHYFMLHKHSDEPEEERIEFLKLCILKGANIFLKNQNNETIYDIVTKHNYLKVVQFLKTFFESQQNSSSKIQKFDLVQVSNDSHQTAIVLFIDPMYDYITIVYNNPKTEDEMKPINVKESQLTKLQKQKKYISGDFIYDKKMLKEGVLLKDYKNDLFYVRDDTIFRLHNMKMMKGYAGDILLNSGFMFWLL